MTSTPTVNDLMAACSLDAVDYAKETFGIELDFSPESVEDAERVAGILFAARPKGILAKFRRTEPSPETLRRFSMMLGAYVGEVYRKTMGGQWFLHEATQTYAVGTSKDCVFPVAKAYKRLTNGAEDNLWHFYRVVTAPKASG